MPAQNPTAVLNLLLTRYYEPPNSHLYTGTMTKPAHSRFGIESHPNVVLIQTRFADTDLQMHINSIRMGEIFEEARFRFVPSIDFDVRLGIKRQLVAALNHAYIAEALYPDDLQVANGIAKVGRTSWTIGQAAFQGALCVALCDITIVGANAAGPVALDATQRELLQKHARNAGQPDSGGAASDPHRNPRPAAK